jgi:hypothetical protein
MACTVIPSANPTPFLSEDVVKTIQGDFAANCGLWLDVVYPVAFIGEELFDIPTKGNLDGTRLRKFPRVYVNDGTSEYVDVTPNETLKGYTFFEIRDEYDIDRVEEEVDITLSMVFWANMRKIDDRGYDYKTELIADALKCLHEGSYKDRITNVKVQEKFDDVFDRYEFQGTSNRSRNEQTELQQFMYPFTAFKLTFNMKVCTNLNCIPKFTLQATPSDC